MKTALNLFLALVLVGCISQPEPWTPEGDGTRSGEDTVGFETASTETGPGEELSSSIDTDSDCVPVCQGLDCGDDGCGGICGACGANEECVEGACVFQPECDPYEDWVCFPGGVAGEEAGHVCTAEGLYTDSNTAGCSTYKDCPGGSIDDFVCLKPDLTGTMFGNLDYWPTAGGKCFKKCKNTTECDTLASEKSLVCDNLFAKVTTKVCMVPGAFVEFDESSAEACPE
jgi:hypothetical protein